MKNKLYESSLLIPGWRFTVGVDFVWNDHRIEKFEKFDNSIDFPIDIQYTYGYAGAACLTPSCWEPFFESKK